MKPKYFTRILLLISLLAFRLTGLAQTANWIGATDNDWNTAGNWDIGVPAEGTNAIIGIGAIVNYTTPMAATSFAGVNNAGVLTINAAGFNVDAAGLVPYAGSIGGSLSIGANGVVVMTNVGPWLVTSNHTVSVEGGTLIVTNGTGVITFGPNGNHSTANAAGLTNNNGNVTFSQQFQLKGRFSRFHMTGGTLNLLGGGGIFETSNDQERLWLINGGTANLGNFSITRTVHTVGAGGLVISNGIVNCTALQVGNHQSRASVTVAGGVLTNSGLFTINDRNNAATTSERRVFFYVRGTGAVYSSDPGGIIIGNQSNAGSAASSIMGGFLDINSGLLVAEKITLVKDATLSNVHGTLTLGGTGEIYLGSGGLVGNVGVSGTTYTMTLNGGTLAAKADYSIVGNGTLGGTFRVKAADLGNVAYNITNTGVWSGSGNLVKTGAGVLTLMTNNTYSGTTSVNEGTLALGANGSISNSTSVTLASGTTFDVSAVSPGYALNNSRTLAGFGTVTGSLTNLSGSIINPGSNTVAGTLTFANSVSQSGGAVNHFDLPTTPGPSNDRIVINGDLNVSGANTVEVVGGGSPGTVHELFTYGGNFNGTLANFTVTGVNGSLSNNATTKGIYLIVQAATRAPTSNVVWQGNPTTNDWQVLTPNNWLTNGVPTYFVTGDSVVFNSVGAANANVNVVGSPAPAAIVVDAAGNYSFGGSGNISGTGTTLTKTNSGTLTIFTANSYTGPTIIGGGVLEVTTLANGGNNSSIGAAPAGAANLVLDGGSLRYTGTSVGTDRAATLNAGGGTIDISTTATTLTANGALTGPGALTKGGVGTLRLAPANNHAGGTLVNSGVLQIDNAGGLGSGGLTNNSATYRVNGQLVINNLNNFNGSSTVELIGVGNGNVALRGAWSGSGNVSVNFPGQGTNTASQTFTMGGAGGAGGGHMWDFSGNIDFGTNTGFARFNNDSGNVSFGSSNATFNLGTGDMTLSQRNGNTTTHLGALLGGSNTRLSGRRGDVAGVTTYSIGGKNLDTVFDGVITNGINQCAITKVGTGKLTLTGISPYDGATIVEGGTLQIDGQVPSSAVTVNGGTLSGNGVLGAFTYINTGGTLSPGDSIGQLTINNSLQLVFGSTTIMEINKAAGTNDSVVGLTSLFYDGTLIVTNLGGTLTAGDTFTLFVSAPFSYSGVFATLNLPPLNGGLVWDTSGLTVDGTIKVVSPSVPTIQTAVIGNELIMSGTNGPALKDYQVLISTNVALPLASWTTNTTGQFDSLGNFSITNTISPAILRQFFTLQFQLP